VHEINHKKAGLIVDRQKLLLSRMSHNDSEPKNRVKRGTGERSRTQAHLGTKKKRRKKERAK